MNTDDLKVTLPDFDQMLPSEARKQLTQIFYNIFTSTGTYPASRNLKFTFANALHLIRDQKPWVDSIVFDCYSEAEIQFLLKGD